MTVPPGIKVGAIALATLSLFWLPWALTLFLMLLAGLMLPPAPFLIGIIADLLYYPGHGMPWGVIAGTGIALFSALVRYIAKTRIM